ncbi:hypothetical protein POVWA1_050280 [Plasmodium ovale wallikeri]|uniref:Uncharacterized protein n=1 Tax=Plasmodium ovale wallikeri TaxID=864142 RepID=A0A1A8ZL93_PLAOA|nr:hypothetical protein POVWA1_050280 [Plasmodium ovale wallikeri]
MQDEEDGKISTCEGNKRFYAYRLLCDGCQAAANLHDRISKTVAAAPSTRVHLAVLPPCRHAAMPPRHHTILPSSVHSFCKVMQKNVKLYSVYFFRSFFVPFSFLFRSFFAPFFAPFCALRPYQRLPPPLGET